MNTAAGATAALSKQAGMYETLSALADGEVPMSEVAAACNGCTADPQAMAHWHAWHLIGDVLRSDDLATGGDHDVRFLAALRVQLAQEPVVLVPSGPVRGASAGRRPDSAWRRFGLVPTAMAAGFALVAAGLIGVRLVMPAPAPTVARAGAAPTAQGEPGVVTASNAGTAAVAAAAPTTAVEPVAPPTTLAAADVGVQRVHAEAGVALEPPVIAASSKLIRDVRLDRYLAAHQQFAGDSALSMPTAFLRNAAVDAPR